MSSIDFERRMEKLDIFPTVNFSKVVVIVSEDTQFEAGDNTGTTLELNIPFGTQEIADEILLTLSFINYNPYTVENVKIDPAAELGDEVIVSGVSSGLYRQKLEFDHFMWQTIEAPYKSETDNEYKFERVTDREYKRQFADIGTKISQTSEAIALEAQARSDADESLRSSIRETAREVVIDFGLDQFSAYFKFSINGIEIGASDSPFKVVISNNEMGFYENDTKVAYVNNSQFFAPSQVIQNILDLGGYQLDATDGIKFRWRGRMGDE